MTIDIPFSQIFQALIETTRNIWSLEFVLVTLSRSDCEALGTVLKDYHKLQYLDLWISEVNVDDFEVVCQGLARNQGLLCLKLCVSYQLFKCNAMVFKALQEKGNLQKLVIQGSDVREECCQELSVLLKSNEALEELDMSFCDLTDENSEALSSGIRGNKGLKIFEFHRNEFSSEGMNLLLSALKDH